MGFPVYELYNRNRETLKPVSRGDELELFSNCDISERQTSLLGARCVFEFVEIVIAFSFFYCLVSTKWKSKVSRDVNPPISFKNGWPLSQDHEPASN